MSKTPNNLTFPPQPLFSFCNSFLITLTVTIIITIIIIVAEKKKTWAWGSGTLAGYRQAACLLEGGVRVRYRMACAIAGFLLMYEYVSWTTYIHGERGCRAFFFYKKKKRKRGDKYRLGLFCELLSLAWPAYNTWRSVRQDACFVGCVVQVR